MLIRLNARGGGGVLSSTTSTLHASPISARVSVIPPDEISIRTGLSFVVPAAARTGISARLAVAGTKRLAYSRVHRNGTPASSFLDS
jgi:hypothetical protein